MENFKDCYIKWEKPILCVGNEAIERRFFLREDKLITVSMLNKKTGYIWKGADGHVTETDNVCPDIECTVGTDNNSGLSEEYIFAELTCSFDGGYTVKYKASIYPKLPFIRLSQQVKGRKALNESDSINFNGAETSYPAYNALFDLDTLGDTCDVLALPKTHLKSECITLFDKTDIYDTVLKSNKQLVYARQEYHAEGNIMLLTDYEKDETMFVLKEAPTHLSSVAHTGEDMYIAYGYLQVVGTGYDQSVNDGDYSELYGTVVGVGVSDDIESLYQEFETVSNLVAGHKHTYTMSNTWGDRHQDRAVCHDFIIKEIDRAEEIGVDIVQIDDGWQKGITVNSGLSNDGVWGGYYDALSDFWAVNTKKFPEGLEPVVEYAKERGIKLGLWFGPDSSDDFKNWETDVNTLLGLHRKYGICYFKMDGTDIDTKIAEQRYVKLLKTVYKESKGKISFNLDTTAQNRIGYIYNGESGTLFVENRYTDWVNYYPHSTLKNLWSLTRFLHPRRLQFEFLNNRRNVDRYGDDSLAPSKYGIDYEFACTMMSNPLVWMEMSELHADDVELLAKVMKVYREHRELLWDAKIRPIGDEPDGRSFTGFEAICKNGERYLLLFRENTKDTAYKFKLSAPMAKDKIKILYTNAEGKNAFSEASDGIVWECADIRSFVFCKA